MSKHTPGPWHLSNRMCPQDGEGFYWVSADSTLNLKVEPCADGYRIGENEANARLIAAAPDLLAALEAIHESGSYWWQEVGDEIEKMVVAAIAKAKGTES